MTALPTTVPKLPTTVPAFPTTVPKLPTTVAKLPTTVARLSTTVARLSTTVARLPTTVAELSTTVTKLATTVMKGIVSLYFYFDCFFLLFNFFIFQLASAAFFMKLNISYEDIKNDGLSLFGHGVVEKTSTSTFIANGAELAKPLAVALKTLDADVTAVVYPTPAQTAQRDTFRKAVRTELGRLAGQLNLDYAGNEAALLSSGLTMGNPGGAHARKSGELDPPTDIELLDGTAPGCLLIRGKRPTGAVQNIIRASADPAVPAEHGQLFVGGGREREIGPFPSGSVVAVVWACLTSSGMSCNFSASVSRRVQ